MQTFNHNPTVRSINHLMDAYANVNDLEHVLSIYQRLESFGLEADIYTYAIVIKAFVEAKRLDDAFIIFEHLKKNSIVPNQVCVVSTISF
ncbi:MAG: hypothetical protein EXX96DRAFT_546020 [Benjaminiella poitrasii]|nr:MAG: hypothetical protein EXX96DRAFT_546020 [Benjaminiella poitrasii]